jgi:flagellar motility protein MotE (MotC chaperone)
MADARLNTESPAWAVDRLSILELKIWHMQEQTERKDADQEHLARCQAKLEVLLEQRVDLSTAIDQLLEDYQAGRKVMKVYRQMKMYNDPSTNPVLYKK